MLRLEVINDKTKYMVCREAGRALESGTFHFPRIKRFKYMGTVATQLIIYVKENSVQDCQ